MGHKIQPLLLTLLTTTLITSCPPLTSASLLLGQVLIGPSYNKAIELRNPGFFSEAANLTEFGLLWLPDGDKASGWLQLRAPVCEEPLFLQGGGSYVIAHSRATPWLVGNATALSDNFLFDEDDVLALAVRTEHNQWLPVDIVGDPDHFNPSGWPIAGLPNATQNHTLLRKSEIVSPTANWPLSAGTDATSSQWIVLPSSEFQVRKSSDFDAAALSHGTCEDGVGATGDRRSDKSQLKIATWTVDWLFDGISDPDGSPWKNGSSCPGNPGDPSFTPLNQCDAAGALARIQRVASYIEDLDVDILNIVDVESCGVLQQLVDGSDAMYGSYLGIANDSTIQRNLGLLSRLNPTLPVERILGSKPYPLPNSTCGFLGTGTTDVTTNFGTTFQVFNRSVAFIGLELPGFPLDPESCAIREAQAAIVAEEIQRHVVAGREVVLAGNLNDWSGIDVDSLGHNPISRVLEMLQHPAKGVQLRSAGAWLSDLDRYTSKGPAVFGDSPTLQQVDFVLLTPGLASLNVTVQIDHSTSILQSLSSHWPLVVTLQLPDSNGTVALPPANASSNVVATGVNSSFLLPVANTTASTTSKGPTRSKLLPIVAGTLGTVVAFLALFLMVALLLLRRRKRVYSHKRLRPPERLSRVEDLERMEPPVLEQGSASNRGSDDIAEDLLKMSEEWRRPIDRSMPTIKSGELLEVELYAKSPFDD